MPFPVRFSPPVTAAAAAAGAVLAAVAIRRYLSSSHHRPSSASVTMSAHSSSSGAAVELVVAGKSSEDQQLLFSAASSVSLGEGGGEVTVELASDAPVDGEGGAFDVGAYMDSLRARRFGRWMLWSPRLASTQDLVAQNFSKLPVGAVCVADVQFKGRGRSKNVWESPPGCLMFSFTSQMQDARKLPLMQYVVCLSMTEAIKELCRAKGLPELDVRIKWPNDLYLKGLKVGGILCTSSYEPKVYNICTGFQALEKQYYDSWLHSGQKVVVQDVHEGQSSGSVVTIQDGQNYELHPDGNSFDFFTGLVRRKMET
ncbi:hypothetical protein PR202_gb06306 [Eleusine coracana subsp. coracana]|uniref:BPL/LPL catalytic domain-containing protein n=1 Tax=Eleusine coracana subsp. coracana TaxID=191504 RepID=A0AAV5E909_ELECO|nr:hypothetical protein PR202_gb06306 [Eleusine coracana subsp. coracana]